MPDFLRITEIYYDGQVPRTEGDEFVEIQNLGNKVAYLVRVRILTQSATARSPVAYGFPPGTKLAPGEIMLIAKSARQFAARFGEQPDFEARSSGAGFRNTTEVPNLVHDRRVSRRTWALANSGATVALLSDKGDVIDVIAYGYDPKGYLGLHGLFPAASEGKSLHRVLFEETSPSTPAALHIDAPSPGAVPPPPTPTPIAAPSPPPKPSPTAPPLPSPTSKPATPTLTSTAIPPTAVPRATATPSPTAAPSPTPTPRPTATPTPPPPTPTPTPTILQCLTDFPRSQSPQRVEVVGMVTEIRPLPNETLVFIADRCGGAVLHLPIDVSTPPTGSRIRLSVSAYSSDFRTDLYLAPGTGIEHLSGSELPQAIPFIQALINGATTGTLVRSRGFVSRSTDFTGKPIYETVASYIRLDPHARAVPLGAVVLYGILEWRDAMPLLRVHYVAPARSNKPRWADALRYWIAPRVATQHARDVINFLLVKSLSRGRSLSLP